MSERFEDRNAMGNAAEQIVFHDLRARGWNVEHGPRHFWSAGLNRVMGDWEDSHNAPCFLRWAPDWMVWRPDPGSWPSKNLFAVDVKTGGFHVERRALKTYESYATRFNVPVVVIFAVTDLLLASSPGKLALNTLPRLGSDAGSGTPYFTVDIRKLSPLERWFGVKP